MKTFEEFAADAASWDAFLEYKLSGDHLSAREKAQLTSYVQDRLYLADVQAYLSQATFPNPVLKTINKQSSSAKRTVFTFDEHKNIFLKFVSFYLLQYDASFSENLCSFRKDICVKTAVKKLLRQPDIAQMYCYKVDISNYFGSVNVALLLPMLESVLSENKLLFSFIRSLLLNPYAEKDEQTIPVEKGILAGVPISAFLANLYLSDLDEHFTKKEITYIRYSDDIIVFAKTPEALSLYRLEIFEFLKQKGLRVNQKKEAFTSPGEKWEFLGFSFQNGTVDISEVSVDKLKKKMKRKARALVRWKERKPADSTRAVRAFIKTFNKKLFFGAAENSITWARWYFPVINTTDSLHELDLYMQECIRYIAQGSYSKARFNLRYTTMKQLGYISLVNRYYSFRNREK